MKMEYLATRKLPMIIDENNPRDRDYFEGENGIIYVAVEEPRENSIKFEHEGLIKHLVATNLESKVWPSGIRTFNSKRKATK